jgi:hypothetical protein
MLWLLLSCGPDEPPTWSDELWFYDDHVSNNPTAWELFAFRADYAWWLIDADGRGAGLRRVRGPLGARGGRRRRAASGR